MLSSESRGQLRPHLMWATGAVGLLSVGLAAGYLLPTNATPSAESPAAETTARPADGQTGVEVVDRVSSATRVWTDTSGLGNERFDVRVLPTIWLIDSSGRQTAVAHGMIDWDSAKVERMVGLFTDGEVVDND